MNMRLRSTPPSLEREGFVLADHRVEGDWSNPQWLESVYAALVPTS